MEHLSKIVNRMIFIVVLFIIAAGIIPSLVKAAGDLLYEHSGNIRMTKDAVAPISILQLCINGYAYIIATTTNGIAVTQSFVGRGKSAPLRCT